MWRFPPVPCWSSESREQSQMVDGWVVFVRQVTAVIDALVCVQNIHPVGLRRAPKEDHCPCKGGFTK